MEEDGRRARQNGAMGHPTRLPRGAVLLLALVPCAACQSGAIRKGDSAFRSGDYLGAWHAYAEAGDPAEHPELAARMARTRWFLIEDGIRHMLASGGSREAVSLLPELAPMAPADRRQALAELEARGRDHLGSRHIQLAEELLEDSEFQAALQELALALTWNPQDELAANLFQRTRDRLEREAHLGDTLYFEGMEHLRHGYDLRARASFHHAALQLGPESRAQSRYDALSDDLAAASRAEARALLAADQLGKAFLAIRTADRLVPEHPETLVLVERLQNELSSARNLSAGDLAIRGGRVEQARELLAELEAWDVPIHRAQRAALAQRTNELALDQSYRFARALELDEQIVRAAAEYRAILQQDQGFGWADTELRLSRMEERVRRAEASYRAALQAEAAGDQEAYRERLTEAVRAASDYADALERLSALLAASLPAAGGA